MGGTGHLARYTALSTIAPGKLSQSPVASRRGARELQPGDRREGEGKAEVLAEEGMSGRGGAGLAALCP